MQTNDEAVAMIKERRASRDCDTCVNDDNSICKICLATADKYFYEEPANESAD